jgi:hypothetical protein
MARGNNYSVGNIPPQVAWTVVRGDTAAFRIYLADDTKTALTISDWNIAMKIKRPNLIKNLGIITDDATLILTLTPAQDADDLAGEFTVSLTAQQSAILQTGDIFDIQVSQAGTVWTVAQGKMIILEDVTD